MTRKFRVPRDFLQTNTPSPSSSHEQPHQNCAVPRSRHCVSQKLRLLRRGAAAEAGSCSSPRCAGSSWRAPCLERLERLGPTGPPKSRSAPVGAAVHAVAVVAVVPGGNPSTNRRVIEQEWWSGRWRVYRKNALGEGNRFLNCPGIRTPTEQPLTGISNPFFASFLGGISQTIRWSESISFESPHVFHLNLVHTLDQQKLPYCTPNWGDRKTSQL